MFVDLVVELIETGVHDLHADPDVTLTKQRSVELHCVGAV